MQISGGCSGDYIRSIANLWLSASRPFLSWLRVPFCSHRKKDTAARGAMGRGDKARRKFGRRKEEREDGGVFEI